MQMQMLVQMLVRMQVQVLEQQMRGQMQMRINSSSQGHRMVRVTPNRTQITTTTMMGEKEALVMAVISLPLTEQRDESKESFIHYQLRKGQDL
jgi:hypothetical protein